MSSVRWEHFKAERPLLPPTSQSHKFSRYRKRMEATGNLTGRSSECCLDEHNITRLVQTLEPVVMVTSRWNTARTCVCTVVILALIHRRSECIPTKGPNTSHVCAFYSPECHQTNCPTEKTCRTYTGKVSHCFALFTNTSQGVQVIHKGCWLQNLVDCPPSPKCESKKTNSTHGLKFCCCTGNNCNENVY